MKKILIILVLQLFISCNNTDENNTNSNETNVGLVTGINIRNSEYNQPIQLGNPNVFTDGQFIAYPNPPIGTLSLSSSLNISDVWIRSANADKIFQETDFNTLLNSDLYSETQIQSDSQLEFIDINSTNVNLNLEDLNSGYYRVFVKINGKIYWDNIYVQNGDIQIEDLIDYWK